MYQEKCGDAYRAVRWYRKKYNEHRTLIGQSLAPALEEAMNCQRLRERARYWTTAAKINRVAVERLTDPVAAIRFVFGSYADQALAVAACESGHSRTPRAQNGQYLGMFQMGDYARSTYGHGDTPLEQARAAYRYFVASGRDWSPWSCKP